LRVCLANSAATNRWVVSSTAEILKKRAGDQPAVRDVLAASAIVRESKSEVTLTEQVELDTRAAG
jgi:hypothetical protein